MCGLGAGLAARRRHVGAPVPAADQRGQGASSSAKTPRLASLALLKATGSILCLSLRCEHLRAACSKQLEERGLTFSTTRCSQATKEDPHTWAHDGDMSTTYGLEPNFGCCTANFNQARRLPLSHTTHTWLLSTPISRPWGTLARHSSNWFHSAARCGGNRDFRN